MFYTVLAFLYILAIGVAAILDHIERGSFSIYRQKISVKRYWRHVLACFLLLFLPDALPFALKILCCSLFLVCFLAKLAGDLKPALAEKIVAFLDPDIFDHDRAGYSLRDRRIRREFDAVARLVRDGNKKAALKLCHMLAKNGDMSPATVSMVRGYLDAASQTAPDAVLRLTQPAPDHSDVVSQNANADQLIAEHRFGTAAEVLKQELAARPDDFDLYLKYQDLLARHCSNPRAAEQALRHMLGRNVFSPEQFATAGDRLQAVHWDFQPEDERANRPKTRKNQTRKRVPNWSQNTF